MEKMNVILSDGQALTYYVATVTTGEETYYFEINKDKNYFAVYLIDEHQRRLEISTILGSVEMIIDEEVRYNYWKALRSTINSDWVVSDGEYSERAMTKEEEEAFLFLKEKVLDEMSEGMPI
ncbi:hypothetical protein BAMA_07825 [Bacillus manliponensis]|uniref:Uncharacterized protein n=1 Tax=Bacillus manliponensis TaxID=574376 RepID=A0A073JUV9_9BACI|nr:hypothetical protein [Bacillus manliponensis]KEK17936.1 hypothetical protein BAMA_07825 [Bacillus manliponensis]